LTARQWEKVRTKGFDNCGDKTSSEDEDAFEKDESSSEEEESEE